jgi:hypothetical protein
VFPHGDLALREEIGRGSFGIVHRALLRGRDVVCAKVG